MKKILFLFAMMLTVVTASANVKYATFGDNVTNGTYSSPTYTWTGSTSNLITVFDFSGDNAGKLADYTKLKLTFSNLTGGMVRVGYYKGSTYTQLGSYGSAGTKEIDLSTISDPQDVTRIVFGGTSSESGSVTVHWSGFWLENDDDAVVTAGFEAPASNATYTAPTYTSTASTNNLMKVFSGTAGDFSKYGALQVTMGTVTTGLFRIGFHHGSTFTILNGSGYGSVGTKDVIDLSSYSSAADAATSLQFGSLNGAGTCEILPNNIILVRSEAYTRSFTAGQTATVWLPFALTAEEVTAAGTFYELTAATSTTLTFSEVSTTEAYKPYIFVAKATGTPFSGMKTKTIVAPTTCSYTVGAATFVGTMKNGTVPSGAYGYNISNGAFSKTTSDAVTIAPFRGYITIEGAGSRELEINIEGNVTGIHEMKAVNDKKDNDNIIYNLGGQRVDANYKGIVIKNGKKMIQ